MYLLLTSRPDDSPEDEKDFRDSELFRTCVDMGLIPRDEADLEAREQRASSGKGGPDRAEEILREAFDREAADTAQEQPGLDLTLKVEGMWCPVCAWLIEEVLGKTDGVLKAKADFLSDLVEIRYKPQQIGQRELTGRIGSLGYRASDPKEDSSEGGGRSEKRDLLLRLGVAAFLTANLMMISFSLYMGFFQELSERAIRYLSFPIFVLAVPVVFYSGKPVLKRAFAGIVRGHIFMDTLIAAGSLSAFAYSLYQLAAGGLHLYFDTSAMLITLVLLGRYIELHVRAGILESITELKSLAKSKVRLVDDEGNERWVSNEAVEPKDVFIVREGERIPTDGRIVEGEGRADESILTGESKPVKKRPGDEVLGGALLVQGDVRIEAARVGAQSAVGRMVESIKEALERKNPMEQTADRLIRLLMPGIVIIAAFAAGLALALGTSVHEALLRAVAVMVITCPCALGIAVPLAKVAALGRAGKLGLLVRNPDALEVAKSLDTIVFDKTGTLTYGRFALTEAVFEKGEEKRALELAASVESLSDHPLARGIVRKAEEESLDIQIPDAFEEVEGMGVEGFVLGTPVLVGNADFMGSEGLCLPEDLRSEADGLASKGKTVVYAAWDGRVRGFFGFGDRVRPNAKRTVERLRARGADLYVVSGDRVETTQAVALDLGVDHYIGRALPKDKIALIRRLQDEGRLVGMAGDGINDAPALVQADVGIALGADSRIHQGSSDVVVLSKDPEAVLELMALSRLTVRTIRQNLALALIYNGLAVPAAVAGLVNPLVAVIAMFASSLTVIGNTMRISRRPIR